MASKRRVVELWQFDGAAGEETHGGENNGSARRVFCPANAKYSNQKGLSSWANRRAFGFFESGNGADPPRAGGVSGQVNTVDYITGMPDLRSEHLHAIDLLDSQGEGYDRCSIVWNAECVDYEGLNIDWASVPDPHSAYWADAVHAIAYGQEDVTDAAGLDYYNFPPGIWANANDTLAGEGITSASASLAVLNNSPLTSGTNWSVAGGFALSANTAVYTHAGGTGTLTQTTGNFAAAAIASHRYILKYEVTSSTLTGSMALSGIGTSAALPITNGTHTVEFTTAGTVGNFVLTVTSSAGNITLDNIFVVLDLTAGANGRPRPMFGAANNGTFNESPAVAVQGALAMRGHSFVFGSDAVDRYSTYRVPRGMPTNQAIAYGATQWGQTIKVAGGATYGRLPRAGDRYKVVIDIGKPVYATLGTAGPAGGQDAMPVDLKVSGLARIYFAMCSVGVAFANTGPGITPEFLRSSPIAPATAPRQHIRGRMYALLTRN